MPRPAWQNRRSRWWLRFAVALVALLVALFVAGPRVEIDTRLRPLALPDDLTAWLAAAEARVHPLPGTEKTIRWAATPGQRTPWALVYLHGFSASRQETAPLAERVAEALGANLFQTRFTGHGLDGTALAEARVNDWLHDGREALAIGQRLGERVIVLGVSNGGTVATWLATQPDGANAVFVLLAPNYGPRQSATEILVWPWALVLATALIGPEYHWQPKNPQHAHYWTHRYPTAALLPMMGMVQLARASPVETVRAPLLLLYSPRDRVVDPARAEALFARWGAPRKELVAIETPADPDGHVLAGDILAPSDTKRITEHIIRFIRALPQPSSL